MIDVVIVGGGILVMLFLWCSIVLVSVWMWVWLVLGMFISFEIIFIGSLLVNFVMKLKFLVCRVEFR